VTPARARRPCGELTGVRRRRVRGTGCGAVRHGAGCSARVCHGPGHGRARAAPDQRFRRGCVRTCACTRGTCSRPPGTPARAQATSRRAARCCTLAGCACRRSPACARARRHTRSSSPRALQRCWSCTLRRTLVHAHTHTHTHTWAHAIYTPTRTPAAHTHTSRTHSSARTGPDRDALLCCCRANPADADALADTMTWLLRQLSTTVGSSRLALQAATAGLAVRRQRRRMHARLPDD
jgi:hypothetical protein